jgi:hypothetical protein
MTHTPAPRLAAKRGRPTVYSPELAKRICDLLAIGCTLNEVCRQPDMPHERAVRDWATDPSHPFSPKYARAREIGYHKMADDLLEIVDNGANDWMRRAREDGVIEIVLDREHLLRTEMRFRARQWLLSKALPKIYGDKVQHHVDIRAAAPVVDTDQLTDEQREVLESILLLTAATPELQGPEIDGETLAAGPAVTGRR